MKKIIRMVVVCLMVVMVAAFGLVGCDTARKLGGAETSFPGKISNAKTLSFKMNINYKKGSTDTTINMDCYKKDGEYAYVYTCPQATYASYKNIYADNKLYEVVNFTSNTGSYYTKDDVSVDDESNILYHVTQKIMLTSVAALLTKAHKEQLNGEDVYRYDVEISGKNISIWYNSEVIVKLYVKFDGENGEDAEEYTFLLSDYKFDEEIDGAIFARPNTYGIGYFPSPISFETWMEIITSFAGKLG